MALTVNNNTSAFNVFASYTHNIGNMKKSMSRLSSGTKTAEEDASGVGISERMRAQIRSTGMARQNVENGLSLLQTADSWLQKLNDMLARMHELSVEAGDGTKTTQDITNIQAEFKELQNEIIRVTDGESSAAKFNGLFLFRGGDGRASLGESSTAGISIQIGADLGMKVKLELKQLDKSSTETLSYTKGNGSTGTVNWSVIISGDTSLSVRSTDVIGKITTAIDHVANSRATLGAQQSRLNHTMGGLLSYEDNLRTAESKIRDVDVAKESSEFAKYQILSQISNAMLAQANQIPSSAVQLLG
ncbi:hypothetical protein BVX99_02160 [bacterium F16]|nr:hypothetical protein BVX99_02160 [bacterium F16]